MAKPRPRIKLVSRRALARIAVILTILGALSIWGFSVMIVMPGKSYAGDLPPLTPQERIFQEELRQDVEKIAGEGEHNYVFYNNLVAVASFLESSLAAAGYKVRRERYEANGQQFDNLEVEITGREKADEIVVIGAHYDSVTGSPGANDNGTGAAAVLALARAFAGKNTSRTLRFVEFVNEEPPFFWSEDMGSLVYAKGCSDRGEKIVAMLSLETMGYYSDEPGSQQYPLGLLDMIYPITGNFIAFIGNIASGDLVRQVVGGFRSHTQFPSEGTLLPEFVKGAGWSDHWAFWQQGYPALMVTDTAPFRYPYYHTTEDTPDKVDYDRLSRVVAGIERVIAELVVLK
ncbi:MAG: M28 family peptidase [Oscillatoria sp. SIO1A7]|nr:M28 family peptidase [Oscillatoria sp. SIO1A7]